MPLDNHWQTQFNSVNNKVCKVLNTQEIPSLENPVNPVRSLAIIACKCISKQDKSPQIYSAYPNYTDYIVFTTSEQSACEYICIVEIFPLMILFVTNDRNAYDMYNISNFYSII